MARGRTITSFGQAFASLSHGTASTPPERVEFKMAKRTIRFKINDRDLIFTMPARADKFKMEDR